MVAEAAIVVQHAVFELRPRSEEVVQGIADAVSRFGVHRHLLLAGEFGQVREEFPLHGRWNGRRRQVTFFPRWVVTVGSIGSDATTGRRRAPG
ncbi:hypothetical protein BG842_20065 [Haladaptatus sp. W1]|nr:hypothetical protein BG842_20065 [Haladaptatus sp. W1]